MKIWKLMFDQDYEHVFYKDEEIGMFFADKFKGEIIENIPKIIEIKTVCHYKPNLKGDIYNDGYVMYLSQRGYEVLKKVLDKNVQYIPVYHDKYGKCYSINVIKVIECIISKKVYDIYINNKMKHIEEYNLKRDINYPSIFKIKEEGKIETYVSDEFVEEVEKNNLKGLYLQEIWDDKQ